MNKWIPIDKVARALAKKYYDWGYALFVGLFICKRFFIFLLKKQQKTK